MCSLACVLYIYVHFSIQLSIILLLPSSHYSFSSVSIGRLFLIKIFHFIEQHKYEQMTWKTRAEKNASSSFYIVSQVFQIGAGAWRESMRERYNWQFNETGIEIKFVLRQKKGEGEVGQKRRAFCVRSPNSARRRKKTKQKLIKLVSSSAIVREKLR